MFLKHVTAAQEGKKSRICLFMRYSQEKENCCYISLQFPFRHLKLNLKLFFFCLQANTQYHYSKLGKHFTPHSQVEKTFVVNFFLFFALFFFTFAYPNSCDHKNIFLVNKKSVVNLKVSIKKKPFEKKRKRDGG